MLVKFSSCTSIYDINGFYTFDSVYLELVRPSERQWSADPPIPPFGGMQSVDLSNAGELVHDRRDYRNRSYIRHGLRSVGQKCLKHQYWFTLETIQVWIRWFSQSSRQVTHTFPGMA